MDKLIRPSPEPSDDNDDLRAAPVEHLPVCQLGSAGGRVLIELFGLYDTIMQERATGQQAIV
jgi:hypothetical protein